MKYLFLPCLLALSILTHAQRYEIKTLGILKDQKNTPDLVKYGSRFYGITSAAKARMGWTMNMEKAKSSNKLLAYDKQVNLFKETELENGKEVFGPFSSFLEIISNKLYFISYRYTESTGIEIFAAEVDTVSVSPREAKKIITIDQKNVGLFKTMNLFYSYNFVVKASPDQSKYLFLWMPGVNETFFFTVTDNKLNKLNSVNGSIEKASDPLFDNCIVDNAGNFFMGYKYKRKGTFYSGLVTSVNGVTKEAPISLKEGSPHDVYVSIGSADDHVRVYGTYSNDGYYITGGFSYNLDKKSLAMKGLLQKPVPEAIVEKLDKEGYAKTKKKDYGAFPEVHFETKDLDNGAIIMAGDLTRYQTVGSGISASSEPVLGTTLVLIIKKDDIIFSRLPKKETMDAGNNFFLHKWGDKAVLLYADIDSNLDKPLEEAESANFTSRKNNVMVAALLETDGKITRKRLYPDTPGSFYFSPAFLVSIADDAMLIGLGKDKIRLTSIRTTQQFYLLKIVDE